MNKSAILYYSKRTIGVFGICCLFVVFFGIIYIVGRKIYTNPWVAVVTLILCPFMAFGFVFDTKGYGKQNLYSFLFAILLLSAWCGYSSLMNGKTSPEVQSLFLKGQKKHHQVWVEGHWEQDGDEDTYIEAHYETQYYFELGPSQSKFVADAIEVTLAILSLGIPILTYFICRKHLK